MNAEYHREYYQRRKDEDPEYLNKVLAVKKQRKAELRQRVRDLKLRCQRCGETDPACLDLHHRDPKAKVMTVSYMVNHGWSWERVQEEVAKCDVLCANCHRKAHYYGASSMW